MKKLFIVFGTRPEAIKMCPLILEIKKNSFFECVVCLTGQHKEMLYQVMNAFGIVEDYNLNIMKEAQSLTSITTSILEKIAPILEQERPDAVLVHGDTTTSFAAGLASFYQMIPVVHVEAGLRTGNIYSPFPEEMNRLLTGRIASINFAPTESNRHNLEKEHALGKIFVTGNTVIDAFNTTIKENYLFVDTKLRELFKDNKKIILVTAHRRENLGTPLENICIAIRELAKKYAAIQFVYPVHLNPKVRKIVFDRLSGIKNVLLIEPLDIIDMHNLMKRSFLVMTDSGGIQEEAPSLGKPVLVLRNETERPEAVIAGTVKVIGTEADRIVQETSLLIDDSNEYDQMAHAVNPYGDGHASERIVDILRNVL